MKLPPKKRGQQLNLSFEKEVQQFTVYTTVIGDFFEEATMRLFGGTRFSTINGVDYCPDIEKTKKLYLEVKASGRSNRVILYQNRLRRELKWCEDNKISIEYVVWSHNCYTKECQNSQEMLNSLAETTSHVLRAPLETLIELTKDLPLKAINRWNQNGYTHGWQLPIKKILEKCNVQKNRKFLKVDKQIIRKFSIHTIEVPDPDWNAVEDTVSRQPDVCSLEGGCLPQGLRKPNSSSSHRRAAR